MSNLLDLSAKIDPISVALFATVNEAAGSLGIAFLVVGAAARDMVFELGHGLPSRRATLDRDFGFRVSGWDEFEKLKKSLLAIGPFKETREVQRLLYRGELRVDILPFGGIAGAGGEIRWPPSRRGCCDERGRVRGRLPGGASCEGQSQSTARHLGGLHSRFDDPEAYLMGRSPSRAAARCDRLGIHP